MYRVCTDISAIQLAVVPDLDLRQARGVNVDALGELVQDPPPRRRLGARPTRKRGTRCRDGGIDVARIATRDLRQASPSYGFSETK